MKTLYIDCSAGISGDMLLAAMREILEETGRGVELPKIVPGSHRNDSLEHTGHEHDSHGHGRSYNEVRKLIDRADAGERAKVFAQRIYEAIAKAEAQVHGKTLETVHFHEVGRDQAIENALGIGAVLEALETCEIYVSPIYDGSGYVDCAHGRIPVPVPAVQAMKSQCPDYLFKRADEVETEMVTPSGLASLIGIGAKAAEEEWIPSGNRIAFAEVRGTRDTGRGGLKLSLYEQEF